MNEDLKVEKGIIIPLDLLNNKKLKLKEIISLSFIMHFNVDYFSINTERIGKNALPSYFINKNDLFKLIPLDKRTIKNALNNLLSLNYIKYDSYSGNITNLIKYEHDYKTRGFIFMPIEILYNKNLSLLEKFTLSYTRGYSLNNKDFKFKTKDLSNLFKTSERAIFRTLNKLKQYNLIESNKIGKYRNLIVNQSNIENYFENADIREIREANIREVKEANINSIKTVENINSVQNLTINLGLSDLKAFNKADLLSIKKDLNNKLTKLINNK